VLHFRLHNVRIATRKKLAQFALHWARNEGDWPTLAEHIRRGGIITPEMREFVADVLDSKVIKPQGTISTMGANSIKMKRVRAVFDEMKAGKSKTAAIRAVAERLGLEESTVRRNFATHASHLKKFETWAESIFDSVKKSEENTIKEIEMGKWPAILDRYQVRATQEHFVASILSEIGP
jgi:hypothetical protein